MPTHQPPTTAGLKAEARQWRRDRIERGEIVSHAAALEAVAHAHGFRDWNTAAARLPERPDPAFSLGQRVEGRYLKQAFAGTIIGLEAQGAGALVTLTIAFDHPVDVVAFESFSALRRRVVATVGTDGVSPARTSDGVPHMMIAPGP